MERSRAGVIPIERKETALAMTSNLPTTREEILATGTIDPAIASVLAKNPFPTGSDYTIDLLKEVNTAMLPRLQKSLTDTRPSNIAETEIHIPMEDGYWSRAIVCSPKAPAGKSPLVVLFHGGGHCVGSPETELPIARKLVQGVSAVVVLPSYRLAPEHPYPSSINDAWSTIQHLAKSLCLDETVTDRILPSFVDPATGFIVGGVSSGANLAAALAHLARDNNLFPSLTGQFLSCGTFISPQHIPEKYLHLYLSREQNKSAPLLDESLISLFNNAFVPDHRSPLWAVFDQHHPDDAMGEVAQGHRGLPPAYFQICGVDMSRDDSLIYEKVLREECGIKTRVDLYNGFPHVWWAMDRYFSALDMTKKRVVDTVQGVEWLLQQA